jgi:hypothetical protein
MNVPKIHHFLPRSYLQGFSSEDLISVFDKNKSTFILLPPIKIAAIKHFYKFIDDEGNETTLLENPLLSLIDARSKKIIRELEKTQKIDQSKKQSLTNFIGFLMTRVPTYENQLKIL